MLECLSSVLSAIGLDAQQYVLQIYNRCLRIATTVLKEHAEAGTHICLFCFLMAFCLFHLLFSMATAGTVRYSGYSHTRIFLMNNNTFYFVIQQSQARVLLPQILTVKMTMMMKMTFLTKTL